MTNTRSLDALLDQSGWIHALARRLVADPNLADDLAQSTWIDALSTEPDATRPVRGWLATVMRNRLSRLQRGNANRASRERTASRGERTASTLDVIEKAETHRNVVLAVLALEEPYRSTLLLRFFEQLSYAEIARRTGTTRAGVNSRVTRGLELLRRRLEATYGGDRRALALALIPLAKLPTGVASTIFGVKLMHVLIATSAAAVLTVAVSVGVTGSRREASDPIAVPPAPALATRVAEPTTLVEPSSAERVALAPPSGVESVPSAAQEKRKRTQEESDETKWIADLFHVSPLSRTAESVSISTSSGDIEVLESASGQLEVQTKVRAELGTVSNELLTRVFEDHVTIVEEKGVLRIEDKHKNSRGWEVSFVVQVPGTLPLMANSGSGDIVVRRAASEIGANTGSGDVSILLPQGEVTSVKANTGSGDVVVEVSSIAKALAANTGSGDIVAHIIDGSSPGSAGFHTGSGDVHLVLPPNVVGSFDLETQGDRIVLPRALGIAVEKDRGGQSSARGSVGAGGGSYELRSGQGDLEIELGHALPSRDS